MDGLVEPRRLRGRILQWSGDEAGAGGLPPKAGRILEALLYRGELPRGDIPALLDTGERQARRVVAAVTARGAIVAKRTRAPPRLALPARPAGRCMPGLFPEQPAPGT